MREIDGSGVLAAWEGTLLRAVLTYPDRVVLLLDADRRIVYANEALTDLLGFTREDAIGRRPSELLGNPRADRELVERWRRKAWGKAAFEEDMLAAAADGRDVWLHAWVDPVFETETCEEPAFLLVLLSDITQDRQLRELQRDVLAALTSAMDFDRLGDYVCDRIQEMVPGVIASITQVVEGRLRLWAAPALPPQYAEALNGVAIGEGVASCGTSAFRGRPVMVYDIASDPLWAEYKQDVLPLGLRSCWSFPVKSRGEEVMGTFAFYFREPTGPDAQLERLARACVDLCALALEREDARRELALTRQLDQLTGLPNRLHLRDLVEQAIDADAEGRGVTFHLVDVDRFRTVGDTLGHDVGDQVLATLGNRLRHTVGTLGVVGRMSADVFGVLMPGAERRGAARMAELLREAVAEPLVLAGREVRLTASVGSAQHPATGHDAGTLLAGAEQALTLAKAEGRDTYRFVTPEMNRYAQDRRRLTLALREAAGTGCGFRLEYQPQVRVSDHRLEGLEALLRWYLPEFGDLPPDRFIGLAEELGVIDAIGRWALAEVCRQIAAWRAEGFEVPRVAVNLAASSLRDPGLPDLIEGLLRGHGLPGSVLTVEVTESMTLDLTDDTRAVMGRLRALGVGISIDDFGTGFSSLATLASVPITEVKIDQSFVRAAPEDPTAGALVEAMLGIGASLGLVVVTEGVETTAQRDFLHGHGAAALQGYLISRPLLAPDAAAWLTRCP